MLILDQRTMQIKYRIPAPEIYRISLSPFLDDIAVFHVRAVSETALFTDNRRFTGLGDTFCRSVE